ncbi:hypothetical protein [Flavobacterium cellulosilyticum]|uniref:Fungal lipase-like domain-containing protein n=1 Tax=Flavobacterium cellulosilyticum TaxID=2541731 RepID=A0A4R5CEP5_9FLAO|nr:hypothetical protein [Flavobacterium cellulosilyticum]TDD98558.1 hypothetical protein E0F76_05365 [Flavobacterium cellulosilyticum]
MKKKYFILALTFLCLFLGQSSYAQEGWEDEEEWYTNESWDSNDNDYTDNWQDFLSEWFGLEIAGITDGGNFQLSNGDYFYPDSGNLDEVLVNSYHVSEQYEYVPIGENNGNPGGDESEEPVDDPTDNCSISYCMPGYTLQNCECVKIPPPCDKLVKANLADLVYDSHDGIPNDYSKLPDNVTIINPVTIPGVTFTNTIIGFNSTLYRVDNGNGDVEYVYATEGSTLELQDWLNNGQQATGNIAAQYDLSVDNAIKIQQWASTQGTPKISFTGHSLGGGLANANALATGYPATVFNPAGLHDNTISRLGLNLSYEDGVNYYVNTGEIVDIANTLLSTPARGTRHEIGNNAVVPAAVWYTSTLAGVVYSGYLHTMGSVIANLDCAD